MRIQTLFIAVALTSSGLCPAQVKPAAGPGVTQSGFFCNLKAFQPAERKRWRFLIEEVISGTDSARELSDGYALRMNTRRASLLNVAEWIDLERKCCPFFEFQLDVHGADGSLWLSLKGRDGVKQFIQQDFTGLQEKLAKAGK